MCDGMTHRATRFARGEDLALNLQRESSWAAPHITAGRSATGPTWLPIRADEEPANMLKVADIANRSGQLSEVPPQSLIRLLPPYDRIQDCPRANYLTAKSSTASIPRSMAFRRSGRCAPADSGRGSTICGGVSLRHGEAAKTQRTTGHFSKQFQLSLDHCARCQTASRPARSIPRAAMMRCTVLPFAVKSFAGW